MRKIGRERENSMAKEKNLRKRNSTADFLIFSKQAGENSIEMRVDHICAVRIAVNRLALAGNAT